jgi:hypothetical protein
VHALTSFIVFTILLPSAPYWPHSPYLFQALLVNTCRTCIKHYMVWSRCMLVVVNEYVVEDALSKKALEGNRVACESGSRAGVEAMKLSQRTPSKHAAERSALQNHTRYRLSNINLSFIRSTVLSYNVKQSQHRPALSTR